MSENMSMEAELAKCYGGDKDFWLKWLKERIENMNPQNDSFGLTSLMQEARAIIEKSGLVGYHEWCAERRKAGCGFVELRSPNQFEQPEIKTHIVYAPTTPHEKRSDYKDISSIIRQWYKLDYPTFILEQIDYLICENERKRGGRPKRIIISQEIYDALTRSVEQVMRCNLKTICGVPIEVREEVLFNLPILETDAEE